MKLHRTAPLDSDEHPAEHTGASAPIEADREANYIGAPEDGVASAATSGALVSAPPSPAVQLESHNLASDTSGPSSRAADDGHTSELRMATRSNGVATLANANTTRRSPRNRAASQTYVNSAPGGDVDDTPTRTIALATRGADKGPRAGSSGLEKPRTEDDSSPVASTLPGAPLPTAARGKARELAQWREQMQISSVPSLDGPDELNVARRPNEARKLRYKFATRNRRQAPITFDNANRGSRIDPERVEMAARQSGDQVTPVCAAKSIYISPRAALNDKKQWKYVVNAAERDPRVKQIIRVDICENPFGPCSEQVSLPLGFTSQCKQKYAKKKLLALDSRSGLLEVDTFFIPSCCVCQLILDTSPPSGPMTPIDEALALQPISGANEESNGDSTTSSSSASSLDDGANGGSAP